jgi:hypothetical protein
MYKWYYKKKYALNPRNYYRFGLFYLSLIVVQYHLKREFWLFWGGYSFLKMKGM